LLFLNVETVYKYASPNYTLNRWTVIGMMLMTPMYCYIYYARDNAKGSY